MKIVKRVATVVVAVVCIVVAVVDVVVLTDDINALSVNTWTESFQYCEKILKKILKFFHFVRENGP